VSRPSSYDARCQRRGRLRIRVESGCDAVVRTGLSVSGPFVRRCLIIQSVLRFHIPLIEPDMRISRIRLSDRTSCLGPRKALRKLRQADESHLLIEELVGIALQSPAALLMLLAEPPAQPGRGVSVSFFLYL
jgi:hypothetical protein